MLLKLAISKYLLMKKFVIIIIILIIFAVIFFFWKQRDDGFYSKDISSDRNLPKIMKIESSAFKQNQNIPSVYTCDDKDISPPLKISEVPDGAKSLVLIMDDPDAPSGTWVHWVVWNINPSINEILEGSIPEGGVESVTSFGKSGYGGPCPPSGTHHYFFKLYALDQMLELDSSSKKEDLEKAMEGHIIDQTELIGLYSHK